MVSVQVRRCKIFREFTGEQQRQYFGISRDKTLHHIDTLYYSVFLNEPENVVRLQNEDALPANLVRFLQMLRDIKAYLKLNRGAVIEFGDMESAVKSFSMYEYCVSKNECFDIFISSYLPNNDTPRIVVQLRSRYLVLEGVKKAIEESFSYLKEFLGPFGLFPVKVRENRIDYAFHTNLIQNPYKFFADDKLLLHLKSNMRDFVKYGKITQDGIELETFTLGNRRSNNVYFRGYNKCQEIIRMNYKSFFFQRWYENGLISAFDRYVYETAYELKSYRTGCLVGRLRWYLEYGSDEELKRECRELLESDYIKSDNAGHIAKRIRNVIPEPTLIFNIEYQTKRKFYTTCADWLGIRDVFGAERENTALPVPVEQIVPEHADPLLYDLYLILANGKEILNYLTGFGNSVSFVEDRGLTTKQFKAAGEPYMAWWRRIRATPVEYASPSVLKLYRWYDVNASFLKSRRILSGQVARLAMLHRQSVAERTFEEDMADVLCILNDNDVQKDYYDTRRRRARQLRGILPDDLAEEV